MQCAAIEIGRTIVGLENAHSTEFNKDTPHPVICLLDEQRNVIDKGGTMRLGAHPAKLSPGSRAQECYRVDSISERHRHRYEFNNIYRQRFAAHGMEFSGLSPDGSLVEIMELPNHPWFVAVQFHPEFKSKPTAAHPLFAGFVEPLSSDMRLVQNVLKKSRRLSHERTGSEKPKIIVDEDWKSQVQAEARCGGKTTSRSRGGVHRKARGLPASRRFALRARDHARHAGPGGLGADARSDRDEVGVNLPFAKHCIDTLDILAQKTKGNLTTAEDHLLSRFLHQLRMLYVSVKNQLAATQHVDSRAGRLIPVVADMGGTAGRRHTRRPKHSAPRVKKTPGGRSPRNVPRPGGLLPITEHTGRVRMRFLPAG